jgi:peroxiredoxin
MFRIQDLTITILFVSLIGLSSCGDLPQMGTQSSTDNAFEIEVELQGLSDTWAYWSTENAQGVSTQEDSLYFKQGKFKIFGNTDQPRVYYLTVEGARRHLPLFVEPGEIKVKAHSDSLDKAVVEGSKYQTYLQDYSRQIESFRTEGVELARQMQDWATRTLDTAGRYAKLVEISQLQQQHTLAAISYQKDFPQNNIESPVGAFIAWQNRKAQMYEPAEIITVGEELLAAQPNSVYSSFFRQEIDKVKATMIGQEAPDFALEQPSGEDLSLSSLRGKYVLLDFWASWCAPCRQENPFLVATYQEFGGEDFEILGVSLDRQKAYWEQAIAADGLTWKHVSDLKFWNSDAARLYGIESIPQNLLLDPNGVIVAKNLRGAQLREKLVEIFGARKDYSKG